jgi:hypothetical protein
MRSILLQPEPAAGRTLKKSLHIGEATLESVARRTDER